MDLVGFSSPKSKELVAFYRDVLGLKPTSNDGDGTAAEFELSDGSTLGIWDPQDEKMYHPGAAIMFSVPDATKAVEEFRKRGAQLADVIETPVCFLAPGQDPAGNAIVIHQRKK